MKSPKRKFSLRRLFGVTATCAALLAAITAIGTPPVLAVGASTIVMSIGAFMLVTAPRTWLITSSPIAGFIGGAALGFMLYESPLPGGVYGFVIAFIMLWVLIRVPSERRIRLVTAIAVLFMLLFLVPFLAMWRHHQAEYAIRKARIDIYRSPVSKTNSGRVVAGLLGPYLVEHETTVRLHDSSERASGLWYHDKDLIRLGKQFERIVGVDNLHLVDCDGVTDQGVAILAKLKTLRDIQIVSREISTVGVATFGNTSTIESVLLRCPKVDDGIVPILTALPNLKNVYLDETRVTDLGTKRFATCPKLDQITVPQSATDATVGELRRTIRAVLQIDRKTGQYRGY